MPDSKAEELFLRIIYTTAKWQAEIEAIGKISPDALWRANHNLKAEAETDLRNLVYTRYSVERKLP